jgi:hypothetical protein
MEVQVLMELLTAEPQQPCKQEIVVFYQDIGTSLIISVNIAQQVKTTTSSKENVLPVKADTLIATKSILASQTVGNLSLRSQHKLTVSYPISGEKTSRDVSDVLVGTSTTLRLKNV